MRNTILIVIALVIFVSGGAVVYYGKYRPIRNKAISLKSENDRLKKDLSAVWKSYVKIANIPRYKIDQHIDGLKLKHGSQLTFTPDALMSLTDSVKPLSVEDSIVLKQPERPNFLKRSWRWLFGGK